MKIASIADVKAHLSAYLRESRSGPVIITKNGRPSAVLLPIEDEADLERLILAYSPQFRDLLNRARKTIDNSGGLSHEAFWERIESEAVGNSI